MRGQWSYDYGTCTTMSTPPPPPSRPRLTRSLGSSMVSTWGASCLMCSATSHWSQLPEEKAPAAGSPGGGSTVSSLLTSILYFWQCCTAEKKSTGKKASTGRKQPRVETPLIRRLARQQTSKPSTGSKSIGRTRGNTVQFSRE
ncbi:unnamed protein product [Ectocarpus sp. 12 AP-2014]